MREYPAKNYPKVSVVITCFDDGEFLPEAIASVEASIEKRYEIIIVDDGSTKAQTLKVIDEFKSKKYKIFTQPNKGVSVARNFGIENSCGDYILTLDVDNKIRPMYLDRACKILDAMPSVGVVYSDYEIFGISRGIKSLPDFNLARLFYGNYIDACSVFRKKAWQEIKGFSQENFNSIFFEDWDFWLSIATRGWEFFHIRECMFDYRKKLVSRTSLAEADASVYADLLLAVYSKHIKHVHQQYRGLFQSLERINKNPTAYAIKSFFKNKMSKQ